MQTAWYIVGCLPGTELGTSETVQELLELFGYESEVACPERESAGIHFEPGYFFVNTSLTPIVPQLLGDLAQVVKVRWGCDDASVDIVRRVAGFGEDEEIVDDFQPGSVVTAVSGPFTGHQGIVESRKGKTYFLRMELFGRHTRVRVHGKDIEAKA